MALLRISMLLLLMPLPDLMDAYCDEHYCGGQHNAFGACFEDVCECYPEYILDESAFPNCREMKLGDPCQEDEGCGGAQDLSCWDLGPGFQCHCQDHLYESRDPNYEPYCEGRKDYDSPCSGDYGRECKDYMDCVYVTEDSMRKCQCVEGYYFEEISSTCDEKLGIEQVCSKSVQCKHNTGCYSGRCGCDVSHYHSTTGNCYARRDLDKYCNGDQCVSPLICTQNRCGCSDPEANYYNGNDCVQRKNKDDSCLNDSANECVSPYTCTNKYGNLHCDCDSSQYYDNGDCHSLKSHGQSCRTGQCQTSFTCSQSLCACTDPDDFYYDGTSQCLEKKTFGEGCQNGVCKSTLDCVQDICVCSADHFKFGGETCKPQINKGGSCTGHSNTECISSYTCISKNGASVCDCESSTQYEDSGQCLPLKPFGERCSGEQCRSTMNCDGTCVCAANHYNNGGETCLQKKDKGVNCDGNNVDECTGSYTCLSKDGALVCDCDSLTQYDDNGQCQPLKPHGDSCIAGQCDIMFVCTQGRCACADPENDYYNGGPDCVKRLQQTDSCTGTQNECISPFTCVNSQCNCQTNEYFHGQQCISKVGHGGKCVTGKDSCFPTLECDDTNMCVCGNDRYLQVAVCVERKPFGEQCGGEQCRSTMNCDGTCVCAANHYNNGGETCLQKKDKGVNCDGNNVDECTGSYTCLSKDGALVCDCDSLTQYDDNGQCQPLKPHGDSCTAGQCDSMFICTQGQCACTDPENDYYNGGPDCVKRLQQTDSCTGTQNECISPFTCVNSQCNCQTNEYFHGQQCISKVGHGGKCVTGKDSCFPTLECDDTYMCVCGNDRYLQGAVCVERKPFGEQCGGEQCRSTMNCDGTCVCAANHYNNGGETCLQKKDKGVNCDGNNVDECTGSYTCLSKDGALVCDCDSLTQYDDNGQCQPLKPHGDSCTAGQCDSMFICTQGQCACTDPENDYYNGGPDCVKRLLQTESCTGKQNECISPFTCVNSQCDCQTNEYFHGQQCISKARHGAKCVAGKDSCLPTLQCDDANMCVCDNDRYLHNTDCVEKAGHGEGCVKGKDSCLPTLQCDDTNMCVCGNDRYLQGAVCVEKIDWRAACANTPNECKGDMACRSNVCDCTDIQFFDGTQCRPMTELRVQNPVVSSITGDSISFTWTTNAFDSSVSYRCTDIPNSGSSTATASGCNVTGLVSGREYGFSVDSYFSADANMAERKTSVALRYVWTLPSKPGTFNRPLSQLSNNPMTFGFMASEGDVSLYNINITMDDVFNTTATVIDNKLGDLYLDNEMTYNYEIIAINGNGDESEKTNGTFTTNGVQRIEFGPLHVGLFVCLGLIHHFLN